MPDPKEVRSMFAGIAGRYDLANRVLSGGVDKRWRRRVITRAGVDLSGRIALDVACGTGDLAAALDAAGAKVLGIDFTYEMVALAPKKLRPGHWLQGDAMRLPVAGESVDIVTIAFGLRNVADRREAFREMRRVLRPGGMLLVLEFGMPDRDLFGRVYRGYLTHVLPRIGGALSGNRSAYTYLDDTVQKWPDADTLRKEMSADGFEDCRVERLWRGIACLHTGVAPGPAQGLASGPVSADGSSTSMDGPSTPCRA